MVEGVTARNTSASPPRDDARKRFTRLRASRRCTSLSRAEFSPSQRLTPYCRIFPFVCRSFPLRTASSSFSFVLDAAGSAGARVATEPQHAVAGYDAQLSRLPARELCPLAFPRKKAATRDYERVSVADDAADRWPREMAGESAARRHLPDAHSARR